MAKKKLQRIRNGKESFRVAIFGSARTKKKDNSYMKVYNLAKLLGREGIDVVTGGGPGTMEAANSGHREGDVNMLSRSLGLLIRLPKEQIANIHLDIKKEFVQFSDRLRRFMELSNVVVVSPGGVGTTLEFFYALQLIQVHYVHNVPIILIGKQWEPLIRWLRKEVLARRFISKHDLDSLFPVKSIHSAFKIILKTREIQETANHNFFKKLREYCRKEKI